MGYISLETVCIDNITCKSCCKILRDNMLNSDYTVYNLKDQHYEFNSCYENNDYISLTNIIKYGIKFCETFNKNCSYRSDRSRSIKCEYSLPEEYTKYDESTPDCDWHRCKKIYHMLSEKPKGELKNFLNNIVKSQQNEQNMEKFRVVCCSENLFGVTKGKIYDVKYTEGYENSLEVTSDSGAVRFYCPSSFTKIESEEAETNTIKYKFTINTECYVIHTNVSNNEIEVYKAKILAITWNNYIVNDTIVDTIVYKCDCVDYKNDAKIIAFVKPDEIFLTRHEAVHQAKKSIKKQYNKEIRNLEII